MQRLVGDMTAAAVCVGLPFLVRVMTGQAFIVLPMSGMTGLAVKNRMVAGKVAHVGRCLIVAGDASRCRPCQSAVVNLLWRVRRMAFPAPAHGKMLHSGGGMTLVTGGDGVRAIRRMLLVAVNTGNAAAMTLAVRFNGEALFLVAFAAILRL